MYSWILAWSILFSLAYDLVILVVMGYTLTLLFITWVKHHIQHFTGK